ncbi:MAG: ribosome-associated translation inhibitor RaiA [Oligoflexales bacterium]
MRFQFSFKHMEVSPALQQYTEEKVKAQIDKFVTKPIEANVTFSVDKHMHRAHLALFGGDGFTVQVEHICPDMYGSVDKLVDKLAIKLRKVKDKIKEHKGKPGTKGLGMRAQEPEVNYSNSEIDAEDIVKYEQRRKRAAG